MSETAFSGGPRASEAFHFSGFRQRLSAEQLARLDPVSQACEEAVQRDRRERGGDDAELYRKLQIEDIGGDVNELLPGHPAFDDGPSDWETP